MRSRYSQSLNTRLQNSNPVSNNISIPDLAAHMATLRLTRGLLEEILALGALELHISTLLSLVDSISASPGHEPCRVWPTVSCLDKTLRLSLPTLSYNYKLV